MDNVDSIKRNKIEDSKQHINMEKIMDGREIILLNVSGEDKPGLTATLTKILADYDVNILDIGQAVIHDVLSLGILFEVPGKHNSSPILKDLLFKTHELGINVKFDPIPEEHYSEWVNSQGRDLFIITLLGRELTSNHISEITTIIYDQGFNIDKIDRLSERIPVGCEDNRKIKRSCIEFAVRGTPDNISEMKKKFLEISHEQNIDISFQKDNIYRRNRRLICFDMDSTLIQCEVIVELAKRAGVGEKVAEITEAAMRGEFDFKESFKRRVALLKGLDESVMKEIAESLPITEGAERLIRNLKHLGYKVAILSGGFTYFGNHLKKVLGVDYVFSNELEIKNGKLTGKHVGEIVDGAKKAEYLKTLIEIEKIHPDQSIAVGDGANDLPMINLAGLGVAFHAKPVVKENSEYSISSLGLDGLLYLLGFRDRDVI